MNSAQKIIQAAAGSAAGEGEYIEDLFSTYLYEGNGTTQTITNDIDLANEGGLVWIKARDAGQIHVLTDTENGVEKYLQTNSSSAIVESNRSVGQFNSDGFYLGDGDSQINGNIYDYVSWTFRKAPKFFDVVTYTGNGAVRTISHNLGSVPGMIVIKCTSAVGKWTVYHRSLTATNYVYLNDTSATGAFTPYFDNTEPTDAVFTLGAGNNNDTNASGESYVAYLFAHNDGDGEFGETGDQDIIKCGSYTGNGNDFDFDVTLGFEPQLVMIKNATATGNNWLLFDNMRGMPVGGADATLVPNTTSTEGDFNYIEITSTGFQVNGNGATGGNGNTFIYIAIRRGPMKTPESGTEVFAIDTLGGTAPNPPGYNAGFPVDMSILAHRTIVSNNETGSRLTGTTRLRTNLTNADDPVTNYKWDYQDGWLDSGNTDSNEISWMFRRAPGFFDVVTYTGDGSADNVIKHNLAAIPELVIIKRRDSTTGWYVGTLFGATDFRSITLNSNSAANVRSYQSHGIYEKPTATEISVGVNTFTNASGSPHIAYLFATLPGISKVGSYTGNGTSQTIDCGFSTGARFVLIKRTDSTSNWNVFDTERGIVAGNDPRLELNTTDAEDTGDDGVDPDSSGFAVNYIATNDDDVNVSGGTYIFLAIA